MSLRPAEIAPVPVASVQVAKAARMHDKPGAVDNEMFASAYPGPSTLAWRRRGSGWTTLPSRQRPAPAHIAPC